MNSIPEVSRYASDMPPPHLLIAPDTVEDQLGLSWELIQLARQDRESLSRQIEESKRIIDRSRQIIAQLDQLFMMPGKK